MKVLISFVSIMFWVVYHTNLMIRTFLLASHNARTQHSRQCVNRISTALLREQSFSSLSGVLGMCPGQEWGVRRGWLEMRVWMMLELGGLLAG